MFVDSNYSIRLFSSSMPFVFFASEDMFPESKASKRSRHSSSTSSRSPAQPVSSATSFTSIGSSTISSKRKSSSPSSSSDAFSTPLSSTSATSFSSLGSGSIYSPTPTMPSASSSLPAPAYLAPGTTMHTLSAHRNRRTPSPQMQSLGASNASSSSTGGEDD
ncbi:uncharacterized protein MONOS_15640 [Monocercomonoides exilis]|uniref:uncharacterized protein n=1 Tax=Monocercomonoides exilis TaxID=2049356 RepID=UPI00355ACB80|nr:hypothetical protein MONOS_15640 [Monocercomonoides exilis]|eukprot:MONOS_15640.1-p1 / transcript=MONOS_15640.1 / gene=MONOS_15640 / organism=Monocercomonoides_exilis_PA203 / gene_product=unspecified product / transcript_product=unspecified product / location=Mono_scaffold01294:9944-10429(+) / protein_length=162 / sequence_SO=supercontig / SO=protein_coding / is_pseudo=false